MLKDDVLFEYEEQEKDVSLTMVVTVFIFAGFSEKLKSAVEDGLPFLYIMLVDDCVLRADEIESWQYETEGAQLSLFPTSTNKHHAVVCSARWIENYGLPF